MEFANDIYNSYHGLTASITESSNRMAEVCDSLGMDNQKEALTAMREKLQTHKFSIGVLGEFKRGKSTVINAMLGREIMPSEIVPTTATMNRVSYGLTPKVCLHMIDGTQQEIPVEELSSYVTKLDADSSAQAEKVDEAVVYYPCQFCQNGVDIVDTPGLNDNGRMDRITEETIPKLDAVIMVTVPGSPFSESEAEFVRSKLMCSDVSRLIFLVNKIDTVRKKSDRVRIVEEIKVRIRKSVLEKTKKVYGEDSEQYHATEAKLGDIRVFPISALDALEGRMDNDPELLEKSGMLQFEEALSHMLTEERGLLELTPPLSRLVSTGKEVLDHVHVMQGSLEADAETFQATQEEVKKEISSIKENEEAKIVHLSAMEKDVKRSLRQKAADCYEDMRSAAQEIIDSVTVDGKKELNDNEKAQLVTDTCKKIEDRMNDVMSIHAERLTNELNQILEDEGSDIAANIITKGILNLEGKFNNMAAKKKQTPLPDGLGSDAMATALETATTYMGIVGVGGLLSGYRAAGVKGAAVGGIAGAAITYGAVVGLAAITGPISLPLVVLTSAAGTLGGGKLAEFIFRDDRIKKQLKEIKEDLSKKVDAMMTELRANHELENWIENEVSTQFDALISDMKLQCGRIADDAARRLEEAEKNLYADEVDRKNERSRLDNLEKETEAIVEKVTKIYEDLEGFSKTA